MSEQAQFGFAFDVPMPPASEMVQEVAEEIADPPEVVLEQPTKRELERDGQMALIDVGE